MKKITANLTYVNTLDSAGDEVEYRPTEGYLYEYRGFKFLIHRDERIKNTWKASELSTGYGMGSRVKDSKIEKVKNNIQEAFNQGKIRIQAREHINRQPCINSHLYE